MIMKKKKEVKFWNDSIQEIAKLRKPPVSVSVASSDVGKCTKCKFNINDRCTVGTYYAEQGKSRFCIEGELWEATER